MQRLISIKVIESDGEKINKFNGDAIMIRNRIAHGHA